MGLSVASNSKIKLRIRLHEIKITHLKIFQIKKKENREHTRPIC